MFTPIPDFNHQGRSFKSVCPITGVPKQASSPTVRLQPHEEDEFILRGPEILFNDGRGEVSLGFFDIRPAAVREAAAQHLGMVNPVIHEAALDRARSRQEMVDTLTEELEELREQVTVLTKLNAKLQTDYEEASQLAELMAALPDEVLETL